MARRSLPPNLYERNGYYSWRNPVTREEFGLGRNKAHAIPQAVEANLHIAKLSQAPRLIDRLTGDSGRSVEAWCKRYQELLQRRVLADNTRRTYRSLGLRMASVLGSQRPLKGITALEISQGLEKVAIAEGKARLAQSLRNFMRDSFRESIVQGWRTDNPVIATKMPIPVEVKRSRLSLETLLKVYERSSPWLQNAIALALTSAQRREDVANAMFADFRDGYWWCVQASEKSTTPHRIQIPLGLKPTGFHLSLEDVVAQCRRTFVASRYLVHQTVSRGNSHVGSQIWVDTISRRFSSTLAMVAGSWEGKDPPTFHEIRSLSERLYSAMGVDTQALLGHTEAATTAIYHNSRGSEWTTVRSRVVSE